MRISDESFYTGKTSSTPRIILGCISALMAVSVIIGAVLLANQDQLNRARNKNENSKVSVPEEETDDKEDLTLSGDTRTSDDLDFWNMYDEPADTSKRHSEKDYKDKLKPVTPSDGTAKPSADEKETDEEDGNAVKGVAAAQGDGKTFNAGDSSTEEIVDIIEEIPRNSFTASGFRQEGNELQYYSANRKISSFGIDVSKYHGDIDWEKVAADGVEFAMVRMGVRGYSTGSVVADEKYTYNMDNAMANGIDLGIYFYSQAITEQEAVEEANYAVAAAAKYNIVYPIVFYTEEITNDSARTDDLSAQKLTDIAKTFCDTVKGYGFKPMICGSKHALAVRMDLTQLSDYDIWLVDAPYLKEGDKLSVSEYPYQYNMWQYSSSGSVDGIDGYADLNISFVDYKYR